MFKNLIIINANTTRDMRFVPVPNWLNWRSTIRLEALQEEASSLAGHYPLVFSQADEGQTLQVIMGAFDRNVFIDEQGRWLVPVIPARLRAFPFAYARNNGIDSYSLVADRDAPQWANDGERLHDDLGESAEFLKRSAEFAKLVLQDALRTQQLVGQLADAGVIAQGVVTVTLKDGSQRAFAGFRTVQEENLAALEPSARDALASTGALALLDAHRTSLKNFSQIN